jgi:tRNA-dihydrouridine synthase B
LKLGNLILPKTAALAPMAGVADRAFREICMAEGACYAVGEMASAKGLEHRSRKTAQLLSVSDAERPCAVQLFGDHPESMAQAALIAQQYRPDALDINMGCPAPKVAGAGSGSALMKNPALATEIIRAVRAVTKLPLTVKIRTGWDSDQINAVELALLAQEAGANAVTVHGRTRMQMYAPPVDLATIARVKEALDIPVIGNGDVCDIESAERMYEETKVDLVMIGRGAQGAPWVFRILKAWLEQGVRLPEPCPEEKMVIMLRQIRLAVEYKGEYIAMREARKHVAWYCKGWWGAAALRRRAGTLTRYEELEELARDALKDQSSEEAT